LTQATNRNPLTDRHKNAAVIGYVHKKNGATKLVQSPKEGLRAAHIIQLDYGWNPWADFEVWRFKKGKRVPLLAFLRRSNSEWTKGL